MRNVTELREELVNAYSDLKNKKLDVQTVKALVAISNSMLKSSSQELDYNKFLGKRTKINFLENE